VNKIIGKIKSWYKGERIECWQCTGPYGLPEFYYKKSPSAKFITHIAKFISANRSWFIPMLVAAFIALFIHFNGKTSTGKAKQKTNTPINYTQVIVHNRHLY
jgi:hypothetical protein